MKPFSILSVALLFSTLSFSQEKRNSTAAEKVFILEKEFVIPNLNAISHKMWVYLPPNYKTSTKNYPVIYMHDAQNLIDDVTSFVGEWGVDETLNELYEETMQGFIVVGVENGGAEPINEYTPWPHEKYGGGKGAIYIDFIVNVLKPYIDTNYRTKPEQEYTSIVGSSLGGLISYYAGLKYSTIFGKVGALSTSFWYSDKVNGFTLDHGNLIAVRIYLLIGEKEGVNVVKNAKNIENLLLKTGFESTNLKSKINPEGKHTESYWKSEFKSVIKWLYKI